MTILPWTLHPPMTPARNALPRKSFPENVYDDMQYEWSCREAARVSGISEEHVESYSSALRAVVSEIMKAFAISPQELGITPRELGITALELGITQAAIGGHSNSANQVPINKITTANQLNTVQYQPQDLWAWPTAAQLPESPLRWDDADYANRKQMFEAMEKGENWEFAECRWLELQEEQYERSELNLAFPGGIRAWKIYAMHHCERWSKLQSRWERSLGDADG